MGWEGRDVLCLFVCLYTFKYTLPSDRRSLDWTLGFRVICVVLLIDFYSSWLLTFFLVKGCEVDLSECEKIQ